MTFSLLDIGLLAIVVFFLISGLYRGFIQTAGNLVGLVLGILVSSYGIWWLNDQFSILEKPILAITIFLLITIIVSRLLGWVVDLLDQIWKFISIIPFTGSINKLLGGILGLIEGAIILSAISYFGTTYLTEGSVRTAIESSEILPWLDWAAGWISVLFPSIPI